VGAWKGEREVLLEKVARKEGESKVSLMMVGGLRGCNSRLLQHKPFQRHWEEGWHKTWLLVRPTASPLDLDVFA
jgi:hypothetical protein